MWEHGAFLDGSSPLPLPRPPAFSLPAPRCSQTRRWPFSTSVFWWRPRWAAGPACAPSQLETLHSGVASQQHPGGLHSRWNTHRPPNKLTVERKECVQRKLTQAYYKMPIPRKETLKGERGKMNGVRESPREDRSWVLSLKFTKTGGQKSQEFSNAGALGLRVPAAAAKSLQSCPTLCDPIDGSPPGSAVPGILQARTLEWVAISFSTKSSYTRSNVLSALIAKFL